MGYTHGTTKDAELRVCTRCGIIYPNTHDYFNYSSSKTKKLLAICKKCQKQKNKEKRQKNIEKNKNKSLFYDGTRKCKKCGRDLPNNRLYFSIDLECKDGLRNVCRECNPKEKGFLSEDYVPQEKWSEYDLQLLKDNYQYYTNKELQEKFFLNRTIRSIESQASVLRCSGKNEAAYRRGRLSQAKIVSELFKGRTMSDNTRQKLSNSRKEYYKTHDGWWKGRKRSESQCMQLSERMKASGRWKGNLNPRHINPLNGENNGRWKGGINNTYAELRSETKEWQQQSMKFCNYRCVISGDEFHNIHHTTAFRDIVDEVFGLTNIDIKPQVKDYTAEEFNTVKTACIQIHDLYGYGACINEKIHKLFHDVYGYTKFTPYDFLNFIHDIDFGKYNVWFENNGLRIDINYDYIEYLESTLLCLESANFYD